MKLATRKLTLAAVLILSLATPVAASSGGPVMGNYWHGFFEFWKGTFQKQNGIVMGVLGLGAVALFIITRGKWKK